MNIELGLRPNIICVDNTLTGPIVRLDMRAIKTREIGRRYQLGDTRYFSGLGFYRVSCILRGLRDEVTWTFAFSKDPDEEAPHDRP